MDAFSVSLLPPGVREKAPSNTGKLEPRNMTSARRQRGIGRQRFQILARAELFSQASDFSCSEYGIALDIRKWHRSPPVPFFLKKVYISWKTGSTYSLLNSIHGNAYPPTQICDSLSIRIMINRQPVRWINALLRWLRSSLWTISVSTADLNHSLQMLTCWPTEQLLFAHLAKRIQTHFNEDSDIRQSLTRTTEHITSYWQKDASVFPEAESFKDNSVFETQAHCLVNKVIITCTRGGRK